MQPNEPTQHPIDYLDSISTAPKKSTSIGGDKFFFGIIGGLVLVAIAAFAFMMLSSGPSVASELSRLSVRLDNLEATSEKARKNTVSSELRATNTNLSLALANAIRDINQPLTSAGADPKKIDPKITAAESTEELTKKLEEARLNGIFDRVYAREMSYQLDTLLVLIEQLEARSKDQSTTEFLSTTRSNLEPLQKQFADFNEAGS